VTQPFNALGQTFKGLDTHWYYDDIHHQEELKHIWYRTWLYACRESELAQPGAYRTITIGTQNILVLRTPSGVIKAYHNVCRHRSSLLCSQPKGNLKGQHIVCPYHQWTYIADDGALARTSSYKEPSNFDRSQYGLFEVSAAVWRGFVFINLAANSEWDESTAFQLPPTTLVNFPMESMQVAHTWTTEIACNWKVFWENFNECLHCPAVHRDLTKLIPLYTRRISNPRDLPGWEAHIQQSDPVYRGGLREGAETWSLDGSAQGAIIQTLTPDELARGHAYASTLPSLYIGGYADHVRTVKVWPLGPQSTGLTVQWLLPKATLERKDYDLDNIVRFGQQVMEEDGDACELSQRGLRAMPLKHGVVMPEEYRVKVFHDWVKSRLPNAS
ncbi:MAG: aromatic ring-hydroxylating dioxygenase subunit alpha, partial [Chromatiales bacterium]|nr:aromatic ring-hydroxylating dioxygenase subunit alpha [Chromatiales bacterium]